jgi:hypothetical protein
MCLKYCQVHYKDPVSWSYTVELGFSDSDSVPASQGPITNFARMHARVSQVWRSLNELHLRVNNMALCRRQLISVCS